MNKRTLSPQFEESVRQSFVVPEVRSEFVDQLYAELMSRDVSTTHKSLPFFGMRMTWVVTIAIVAALIIGTLVIGPQRVYAAVMQLFGLNDPGLKSVQESGLVTDLNITAKPTLLPTQSPTDVFMLPVQLDLSQTLQGITVTLDWAYLDEGRLALSWTTSSLPPDIVFDVPTITFVGITPDQMLGVSQILRHADNQMTYVSYQLIHSASVGGKVDITIDLPLVRPAEQTQNKLANFHFDLKDIPVFSGQFIPLQQTYSVRLNGVEVRLRSVKVMPSSSEVVACYDFPDQIAPFWYMQYATIQIGNGPEESYLPYQYLSEIQNDHCVKLGFSEGSTQGGDKLIFRVHELVVPLTMQDQLPAERIYAANTLLEQYGIEIAPAPAEQSEGSGGWRFVRKPEGNIDPAKDPLLLVTQALEEKVTGPWVFYVDLPSPTVFPGQPTEQPIEQPTSTPVVIGSKTLDGITVTLDWVFVDAKRAAFGYTISGLPNLPDAMFLSGNIVVKDQQGNPVVDGGGGSSSAQWLTGQSGVLVGSWSSLLPGTLNQSQVSLSIDMTLDGSSGFDWNNTIAQLEQPSSATPLPPDSLPSVVPDRLVGTFHFDVQTAVYPMSVIEPKQAFTANGITMRLERAEITPSYARFTLCYPKPSANDWMVGGTPNLKAGIYEAQINGYSLLIDADYGGYVGKSPPPTSLPEVTAGERCVQIDFLLGHSESSQTMTLTIPMLEQSMPEVIPDAELKLAQEKLKAIGIEMDYSTFTSSGGGGGGPIFTKKPEGMTDMEAYQQMMNALGYSHPGPWVFNIELP